MNFLRPIQSRLQDLPSPLPRRHLYGIVLLSGLTLSTAALIPTPGELMDKPVRISIPASLHVPQHPQEQEQVESTEFYTLPNDDIGAAEPVDALDEIAASEPEWQEYVVQNGDTLSTIFNGLGLPLATMYKLLDADENRVLDGLRPGQTLHLMIDENNLLQEFKIQRDIMHTRIFSRSGEGYESRLKTEESHWESRNLRGTINGSFYLSARSAGLSAGQIQKIANLFQWQLNFARDLRQGDSFRVVVKREFVEGQSTGKAELQAVEIVNHGRTYQAFRHEDGNFYDDEGNSMERGFVRIPLKHHARISSNFNLHRKHPVTGRIRPHKGTDFAVPTGTAVLAPGDGVVVKAVRHRLAGNYLVIRHGRKYTTRFLHLSKFLVKPGDKVRRGDRIALSGNTGRSTGPHLHYEFLVNNRPVDPMQVKLPMAEGLTGSARKQFLAKVAQYKQQLAAG
ncbi:murein DD-endopeptidase MepM [Oceanimonas sp. CHS3-5]|uniref:murein DD-endopeptidase MepM n=1 Tax=Oceanimonas sp. CHS3-5 TaxID=3068186 RepID=UPI00273EC596|nr:murein DD-endopeptidase MepM [Oceanimonas sp. CHS3-5]MDP5293504.1 murein DD-endopeptidase MepM [Oceanimonas sp. CHS3-5]